MSRPLIVLRPQPGNAVTVARAKAMGLDTRAMPLFTVEPVTWEADPPDAYDGVLLTSANAVRHAGPQLSDQTALPAYAVGKATAEAARVAGFTSIVTGDADVAQLITQVAARRLLHLSGEDVTAFDARGIEIDRHIVYRAVEAAPPPDFIPMLQESPVILIHSQRAGARFASLVEAPLRPHIALVAISTAAASHAGEGWQKLAVAPEPRDEAMLRIAAELT